MFLSAPKFRVREILEAAFSSISAVLFWKQMNEQTKCWTSETTSTIRLFLAFPGVPTAPVGIVPLNHFIKWSLNRGEMIKGGFQLPPQHSEAGAAPALCCSNH